MKYRDEIEAAGSGDAWRVHEWMDNALSDLRRAIRDAEACQLDDVAGELGEIEDSLAEIMDAVDETAAWVDEGSPDDPDDVKNGLPGETEGAAQ